VKKIIIIVYIILLLIAIKLIATFITDEIFISKYNDGIYDVNDVRSLFILNAFERYTAHYNYGNILYYNNDFDGAIDEYEKALTLSPPKDKEEDIRTNLEIAKSRKENSAGDPDKQGTDEEKQGNKPKEKQKGSDEIEEKLKEIQKESASERQEHLESMKQLDKPYKYYPGKRW